MPKKKFTSDMERGFVGDMVSKKSAPNPWVQPEWISEYLKARDRVIYEDLFTSDETKRLILEKYAK